MRGVEQWWDRSLSCIGGSVMKWRLGDYVDEVCGVVHARAHSDTYRCHCSDDDIIMHCLGGGSHRNTSHPSPFVCLAYRFLKLYSCLRVLELELMSEKIHLFDRLHVTYMFNRLI